MKILNVIKCEFIKNYTWKRMIPICLFLFLCVIIASEFPRLGSEEARLDRKYMENSYRYYQKQVEENPSAENEFGLYYFDYQLELEDSDLSEKEAWVIDCIYEVYSLNQKLFVLNQMLENPNFTYEKKENCATYAEVIYEKIVEELQSDEKSLEELKKGYQEEKERYQKIIDEGIYYRYIEFLLEQEKYIENLEGYGSISISLDEPVTSNEKYRKYYQKIVDKKIKSSKDYQVTNIFLRMNLHKDRKVLEESDFYGTLDKWNYSSYKNYVKSKKKANDFYYQIEAILDYSIEHPKVVDSAIYGNVGISDSFEIYNSKRMANQVLYLGIVIFLLVVMSSSGIVSQEHTAKCDKMLLTAPISRAKIILGKFFYLVMHTYIIWIIAFIMIFIYAGIRLGFADLFSAKLVYYGGKVHEVNYIFYTIGQILICGIPYLAIASILLFLSATTFSTLITNTVTTLLSILSITIGNLVFSIYSTFRLGFWTICLENTPFIYTFPQLMLQEGDHYLEVLGILKISSLKGIVSSVIVIVLSLFLTILFYRKRDIKN